MRTIKLIAAVISAAVIMAGCSGSNSSKSGEPVSAAPQTVVSSSQQSRTTAAETVSTTAASTQQQITTATQQTSSALNINSNVKAAAIYSPDDNRFIFGKAKDTKVPMASTTKLMTALVALKYLSPDSIITAGSELSLVHPESSLCGLYPGCSLTLSQALYGLLLPSGNDAAYTIAVNTARRASGDQTLTDANAVKYFCTLMNSYANELGMTSTHFVNPEGWDDPNHYSTAADMIKLACCALENETIKTVCSTQQYNFTTPAGGNLQWINSNKLIDKQSAYYTPGVFGMKTGTTQNAGSCLITAYKTNGKTFICAVLGASTDDDRYIATRTILNAYAK